MEEQAGRRKIVAVIPALDEAATIRKVVNDTMPRVDHTIVINDGSTDDTVAALEGAPIERLDHPGNLGKGESLRHGIRRAREVSASAVVTLDGDGQHPPKYIPRLLDAHAREPNAVIIGTRTDPAGSAPRARRNANRVADFFLSWAAGESLRDTQSGFRLYPQAALDTLCETIGENFVYESEALISLVERGWRVCYIGIPAIYEDLSRPSHYRPVLDTIRITIRVASRLFRRGMSPFKLGRSHCGGGRHH